MSDLHRDPRFWALTPSQRVALPILTDLMAECGRSGVLHWTRKEIYKATHLGPKSYDVLLVTMDRHQWGGENADGWLMLSGPLAPSVPLVSAPGTDLAALVREAILSAAPAILREYEADRKRQQRSSKMSGTEQANVPDKTAKTEPNVPDIVPHVRARSIDSIRFDLDNILSIDSIDSISNAQDADAVPDKTETTEPNVPDSPTPMLTIVPADVAQELVRKGISSRRAGVLIEQYGLERCATVLACLPHWKFDNAGKVVEDALKRPEVWPIPAAVAQQKLPLLTGQPGGAVPRAAPAAVHQRTNTLHEAREQLTEAEKQRLRCDALERLQPASRGEYDKAISLGHPLGSLLSRELREAEDRILQGRFRQQRSATA
jgi:hypothetical protein